MQTVYYNALVYTGEDKLHQAFAVEDGIFTWVGSNAQALEIEAAEKNDLQGAFVCPGFIDSHMHLLNFGQTLRNAPLHRHTGSLEDMLCCLSQSQPGQGGWILGRGWNQDYFTDVSRMPNRWDLDKVSREHPICASRACGHVLAANSKALELLGITADTPQIPGGQIGIEQEQPNGLFFDNAMDLVLSAIPAPGKEDIKDMLRAACKALNRMGITGCHSDDYCVFQNVPWQTVNEAFRELEASGELTVRVYEQANFTTLPALRQFVEDGNHTGTGSGFFRIGPLKLLGDGALGARTAYLSRPYADAPNTRGLSVFTQAQLDELIGYAHSHGLQVAVHCIGDACLDMVLHSFEKTLAEHPRADHRHGIVHCQITRHEQLEKIARLRLQVYAQSIFLDYDIHIVYPRAGQELASSSYSWKTLRRMGVRVSNGSDCPVETPNVMAGIQCAVTRRDLRGHGPYLEDEAFTVKEALDSFTADGAYAEFRENQKGGIQAGMPADFVILGKNPFHTDPSRIKDIPILGTYLAGKAVYTQG